MDFLPTKKIVRPLLAAAFILGGSLLFSYIDKNRDDLADLTILDDKDALVYSKPSKEDLDKREEIRKSLLAATQNSETTDKKEGEIPTETVEKIKLFKLSELKIIPGDTTALLKKYGIELSQALVKYSDPEKISLVQSALDLHETGDAKYLKRLEGGEDRTIELIDSLSKMDVPKNLGIHHLALLNDLMSSAFFIANMQTIKENPGLGITATEEYSLKMYDIASDLSQINIYMKDMGVTFSDKEKAGIYIDLI